MNNADIIREESFTLKETLEKDFKRQIIYIPNGCVELPTQLNKKIASFSLEIWQMN